MTAEGTARNGAGEAPKAEFATEKVAAAAKAPADREGEDVGGPFVIVNGDSNRGSDLGKAHDEGSPSEADEAPGSNAAPDAPLVGDNGAVAGEAGASAVAPGVSSADGRDRAAEEPKGGADERKDSEVHGKEVAKENSAATDVPELVVDEATSAEQNAEGAALESCGHDDALTKTDSGSATESQVHVDDNGEEQSPTSFEFAAESERHDDEIKLEKNSTEVVLDFVDRGDARGEENGADASQNNVHTHSAVSSDSSIVDSESKVQADGTEGQENDQQEEGAPITEAEVEGVVAAGKKCADIVEVSVEEDSDADGHNCAKVSANASGVTEAVIEKVECEATCGILQVEEEMDKDGEGGLCNDSAAGVAYDEEVKLPAAEGIDDGVPGVDELEQTTEDTNHKIVQDHGLVKDGETDPTVETNQENNFQVQISQVDETAAESDVKADSGVEVNTTAPLLSQRNRDSAVETVDNEQLEAPDVDQPNENEDDVAEAEAMQENETEISDAVPLQADAASSASISHNVPQPMELVDSGGFKHSSPLVSELESCDHAHTEESRSREIPYTTVDRLLSDTSLEHGSTVVGQAELLSVTGDEPQEKSSDSAVDQGGPVTLNANELVVADDAEPSSATGYESVGIDNVGDISKNNDSSDIAGDSRFHEDQLETCNASTACDVVEDIASKSLNASTKSTGLVETKCMEALEPSSVDTVVLAEHKVDDEHAHSEEAKVVEDSIELHGDIHKNIVGDTQVIRQQKVYMIKVPRFASEDLWAKIQEAHTHLDQLTQERDVINIRKQRQKLVCDQYREKLEAARREEREARAAHGDKKNDLNSVRSVIEKLNQANSIEEIDALIAAKENIMQHETISLKEEKLLIKEINDLKAQRKQLQSNMASKDEINEAFDQKEFIHERRKTLKKDSDVLFANLKSLEENTRKIQKAFEDEIIVLRKLNDEYQVANERRQMAYRGWAVLKAEPFKKNKYFFMYKDDQRISGDHLASGNMHQLQLYCNNQVERVMEMWNKDEDFRKQYVEANKISTLKRLGTHDGRRLGPDEEPPVIPSRRPSNPSSSLAVSSPNVPTTTSVPAPAPVSVSVKEDSFPVLPSPDISKRAKSKESGTSAQDEKIAVTVTQIDVKETEKEKARLMEEELERAKKAEELARMEEKQREERAAAEKEQLRLEQKAKAKEAEERKRRKAEKAQERAEFKARKEAEIKEKKKAKKDKKKGPADSSANGDGNATPLATADTDSNTSDNPREVDVPQPTAPKRISRPAAAIKQLNRLQPMPAPLRNRGKRKMRQYILIAAAVLSVLALFVAGNFIARSKSVRH